MRVLFGSDALNGRLTGVGWYAYELAQGLNKSALVQELAFVDHISVSSEMPLPNEANGGSGTTPTGVVRSGRALGWLKRNPLARAARSMVLKQRFRRKLQPYAGWLYHSPNFWLHPHEGPAITTIHDLSTLRYPEYHPADRVRFMARAIPSAIERANAIITVSEFVRQELGELFGVDSHRVHVTRLGVRETFKRLPEAQVETDLSNYGLLPGGYFLFVGGHDPRKNLLNVLRAYAELPASLRSALGLVVVGATPAPRYIRGISLPETLTWLEYASERELASLYNGSRGLLFPSLYEGFGLPVIEALACGVPVIGAASSAIDELSLEGLVKIDPHSVASLRRAMEEVAISPVQSDAARDNAANVRHTFSWANCVERTMQVYQLVGRVHDDAPGIDSMSRGYSAHFRN
jgi:glycosyltransferase involved in cell wall biosynthesis